MTFDSQVDQARKLIKIVIDMNLTPRWTSFLSSHGWETKHWSDIGSPRAKDWEITEWALAEGFLVLTNDLDFPQLLAHTRNAGPSIILLRGEPLIPEIRGEALGQMLRQCQDELIAGAIASLDWGQDFRIRLLPL